MRKSIKKLICTTTFCVTLCFNGTFAAEDVDWQTGYTEAHGVGTSPSWVKSPALARIMAERAAKVNAYGNLLGQIDSTWINHADTVKTVTTDNDGSTRIRMKGTIKCAQVIDTQHLRDGSSRVIIRVPL